MAVAMDIHRRSKQVS